MKRRYTTAQVVAILSRNHDWTAKAPDTKTKLPERCSHTSDGFLFEFFDSDGYWVTNSTSVIPDRDDWEIVRPKRKRVVVGRVKFSVRSIPTWNIDVTHLDESKAYKLVAVEE